jgi:hypothetical protein
MAAGASTLTTLNKLFKTKYDQKMLEFMAYSDDVGLALSRKDRNFGGNDARVSLGYGDPQGGSSVFATAQANASSNLDIGFLLTRVNDYHVATITGEAIDAGKGDENTIYDSMKRVMDGAMRMAKSSLEIAFWGAGGGARGKVASGQGTPTVTLSDITSVVNFEVGMVVSGADGDGSLSAHAARTGTATITAVDRDAGTLTISGNWTSSISSLAANDFLFRSGDFKAVAKGVKAWIPATAPSSGDSFFGVDRSVDTTRLAGCRFTGTGSYEETLVKAEARRTREGGKKGAVCVVNTEQFPDIALSLQSKAHYDPVKDKEGIFSFASLKFHGPNGDLPIVASPRVGRGTFHILQPDTWVIKSNGGAPKVIDTDGLQIMRSASLDQYEIRMVSRWQIACEAPAFNLTGTFAQT